MTLAVMNTKDRQRQRDALAPRAGAPGWLVVAVAGAITIAGLFARSLA
jgi:hypothetical protein